MSGKLPGALLILLGGCLVCLNQRRAVRMEIGLLRELTAALESIETLIRWQKETLPRAILRQCQRPLCGGMFKAVLENVESGNALHDSWKEVFSWSSTTDVAEILCHIELQGDEEQITGNLRAAEQGLERLRQEKMARRRQSEKLCTALVLSGAGLAIIVLI